MNLLIQLKKTAPLLLITLTLHCFGLLPQAPAVVPSPDGGYPGGNTAEGQNALFSLASGVHNTAIGYLSLRNTTTGGYNTALGSGTLAANTADGNTAIGVFALISNTIGGLNTANGSLALFSNTAGEGNMANGFKALYSNTDGDVNTAIGYSALLHNTTGGGNIALGTAAGLNLTTGNNNIDIGNTGVAGEGGTIRIGDSSYQTRTFIAGTRGITTGNANAIPVLIDSSGQLGTASSSRQFKKEIKPMDKASESILSLKPVTFHYKSDAKGTSQFGLIAEEVAEVNADLVVRDENGEIYTVRYDAVNAMLLNEFLKEHRKVEKLEAMVAPQQKRMELLTAQLKEQAAQIQKVSDQLELRKPAPQMACLPAVALREGGNNP